MFVEILIPHAFAVGN